MKMGQWVRLPHSLPFKELKMKNDGGKGSTPRPFSVAHDEWSKRWDAIFSRDLKKEDDQKAEDEAFELIEKQKPQSK
jgi:hypothetical protein